jgi:hypothetical protein
MTANKAFTIVDNDHVFRIPPEIAKCPYCGEKLYAQAIAWQKEDSDEV